jgi:hypothetical protein
LSFVPLSSGKSCLYFWFLGGQLAAAKAHQAIKPEPNKNILENSGVELA